MTKLILHIPHASVKIPHYEGYVVEKEVLNHEIKQLTDWYTDDLFYSEKDEMIVANFSRIFCDVERFTDDEKEVMAQYGMGVLYEKTDKGKQMRKLTSSLKAEVLKNYYNKHHQDFQNAVELQLSQHKKALIIDCHSFPDEPLQRDLDKRANRPDFNIGTDDFHTDKHLVDVAKNYFEEKGYSLGVDYPYRGAIVPLKYYQKDANVQSIMLEVNRKLYMDTLTTQKSKEYEKTKEIVQGFLNLMRDLI